MYKWFLIIMLLLASFRIEAQTKATIDSLEHLLKNSSGKQRTDLLNELGWDLKYTNPDRSLLLTQEALTFAISQSYDKGIALANRNMAGILIIQGKSKDGLTYAEKALSYIENLKEPYHQGKILNLLGIIHRDEKNFKKSLDYQNQALKIFRQIRDTFEIAGNLNNLGLIYKQLGNSDIALKIYLEVQDIEIRKKNDFGIARTSNNLASIYQEMNKYDLAENMYRTSINSAKKINNKQFEAASIHGLGLLYQKIGKPDKAIAEYQKAIVINKEAGFREFLGNNLSQLASVYESQKNYTNAFNTFQEAYNVYKSIANPGQAATALNGMSVQQKNLKNYQMAMTLANDAFKISDSLKDNNNLAGINFNIYQIKKETGQPTEALEHLEKYLALYEEIQKNEKSHMLEEIQTRYEVKNIVDDNSRLKSENQYQQQVIRIQRNTTAGIIMILVVISLLAILIARGRKKLRKVNAELTQKNAEILEQTELLHASNATKDRLFSIIAHDIRNPFAALLNLSEMLNEEVETADKETLRFYANNIHQSANNTFQLLDNLLYWSKSQRGTIEIRPESCDLYKITEEVFNTARAGAIENSISLKNEIPFDTHLTTDKTLLRIILGNLIGNAVKFNNTGGFITVSSSIGNNNITILVKDSGKGISPDRLAQLFNKEESIQPSGSRAKNGTGLGLILCRDFVEKLGGKISIESTVGIGSEFRITLPI